MKFESIPGGWVSRTSDHVAFFGNRESKLENLKEMFPELRWAHIKQVHGKENVGQFFQNISRSAPQADAHWTSRSGLALLISTADCLPVLMQVEGEVCVASVHAGWKGVVARIIPETLKSINPQKGNLIHVAIGPAIQRDSFEVDRDVGEQILSSARNWSPQKGVHYLERDSKMYIDLVEVAKAQCLEFSDFRFAFYQISEDTKTNSKLHSYRRDKKEAGRNLSFIARLQSK
jgi:polyphenol oxidase